MLRALTSRRSTEIGAMNAANQGLRLEDGNISTSDGHTVLQEVPPSLHSVRLHDVSNGIMLSAGTGTASSCHDLPLGRVSFSSMF